VSAGPRMAPNPRELDWSDTRLVKECVEGNETAWSVLIDRYKNLIFSIPVRYGFSQEDSADIFQSVCMDLLVELPQIREPKALPAWLIQVTRNKCFHARKGQLKDSVTELDENLADQQEKVLESVIRQVQEEHLVRQAVGNLSPRCQKMVNMLFFELPARPYSEVAAQLGLASGSIGLMRRRCLEKLRQSLEGLGF